MRPPLPPRSNPALAAYVVAADAKLRGRHAGADLRGGDPAGDPDGDDAGARATSAALLRVTAPDAHPPGELAWCPLDERHPLDLLMGFVAPPHWWALGVSCHGLAHRVDEGHVVRAATSPRVRITVLIDRAGGGAGLMRRGEQLIPLPGPPDGVVADACRRALRLPTAPPPVTTVGLWTRCWLDRLVDTATATSAGGLRSPGCPSAVDTWRAAARLHPASSIAAARRPTSELAPDPDALVDATRVLADCWPWSRLRADPAMLEVPGPLPDARVIAWMDAGMWARWLLAAFPGLDDLLDAVGSLLPPHLVRAVRQVVEASVGGDGDDPPGGPGPPP
jgi:hypothetical protein